MISLSELKTNHLITFLPSTRKDRVTFRFDGTVFHPGAISFPDRCTITVTTPVAGDVLVLKEAIAETSDAGRHGMYLPPKELEKILASMIAGERKREQFTIELAAEPRKRQEPQLEKALPFLEMAI